MDCSRIHDVHLVRPCQGPPVCAFDRSVRLAGHDLHGQHRSGFRQSLAAMDASQPAAGAALIRLAANRESIGSFSAYSHPVGGSDTSVRPEGTAMKSCQRGLRAFTLVEMLVVI